MDCVVVLAFLDALFIYRPHIYPDHTSAEKVIYAFIYLASVMFFF